MTPGPTRRRGSDAVCVLILVAASFLLFAHAFRPGYEFLGISTSLTPPWRPVAGGLAGVQDMSASDALLFTWPNLVHWRESVRSDLTGLLWDPKILCGSPFLATQDTFALYPSNLLALAGGLPFFLLWTSLIHVALANVGAYFALRRLALSAPACAIGAFTFGGGSWFLAHLDVVNFPQAAAWLPWILFAADRAQVEGRTRDRLLLAFCVAMSVFAGMIQVTLISLLVAAFFVRVRAEAQTRSVGARRAWAGAGSVAAGIAIGLLLAGPQLAPLAEWSRHSSRVRAAPADATRYAYRPLEWAHVLVPEILGSPAEISRWSQAGDGAPVLPPTEERAYPPAAFADARGHGATFLESVASPLAIGLILAIVALLRPTRTAAILAFLALAGALLAMNTPLMRALATSPVGAFANPRRFLLLATIGFSGLAAIGAERLLGLRRAPWIVALPAVLVGLWLLLNAILPGTVEGFLASATGKETQTLPQIFLCQALAPFVIFAAGAAIAIAVKAPAARNALLGALALADALAFNVRNNPCRPTEPVFPETEATRYLQERMREPVADPAPIPVAYADPLGPPFRIARFRSASPLIPPPMPPNLALPFGLRDQQGYEGILPRRYEELLDAMEPGMVFEHHMVGEWPDAAVFARPCFDFLGVRCVVSAHHEVPNLFTMKQFPAELCSVFGNAGALPRVTVVTGARVFDSPSELLSAMTGPTFSPTREVFLSRSDLAGAGLPSPGGGGVIELPPPAPGESVRWEQKAAGLAEVEATLSAPRFLVVAETWHAGWKAEDDQGRRIPIVPGNHAFQALFLPAGHTRLKVSFSPVSLVVGSVLAALGLALILVDSIVRRPVRAR